MLPPSNGEALVHGQPITSSGGMDQIRSMMGVCPQFDVLWGELTGAEHLNIYGHVKGVYWRHVNSQCEELLERVSVEKCGIHGGGIRGIRVSYMIRCMSQCVADPCVLLCNVTAHGF